MTPRRLAALLSLAVLALAVPAAAQRLQPTGPPTEVTEAGRSEFFLLDLTFGKEGGSLAVYSRDDISQDFFPDGYTRLLGDGGAPLGGEQRIGEGLSGGVFVADVAALAGGDYLVSYYKSLPIAGGHTSLRRFAADGSPIGPDRFLTPVNPSDFNLGLTQILPLPDGGWSLFWYVDSGSTEPSFFYTRRYSANGSPVPGSTRRLEDRQYVAVDINDAGQAVVLEPRKDGEEWVLLARRLDVHADEVGDVIELARREQSFFRVPPRVAVAPDGGFLAVWGTYPEGQPGQPGRVHAQIVGPAGTLRGETRTFEPPGHTASDSPSVDALPDGSFALALAGRGEGPSRPFLYHLSDTGVVLGRRALADSLGEGPLVAARDDGRIRVLWQEELKAFAQDFATACAGAGAACLQDGRFRVEVAWKTMDGKQGIGTPRPLTPESAAFWFFREENLELFVKVLDACDGYDRYWVFLAGLTNVAVDVTVTDTATGEARTYSNPQKSPFQPIYDTQAFDTCNAEPGGAP